MSNLVTRWQHEIRRIERALEERPRHTLRAWEAGSTAYTAVRSSRFFAVQEDPSLLAAVEAEARAAQDAAQTRYLTNNAAAVAADDAAAAMLVAELARLRGLLQDLADAEALRYGADVRTVRRSYGLAA